MRLSSFLVLLGWTVTSAVCPTPGFASDDEYAAVHTVSIVPGFGNKANIWMKSVNIWDKSSTTIDWNVDNSISEKVSALLNKRFSIKASPIDPQIFLSNTGKLNSSDRAKIASVPDSLRPDAYVVVFPLAMVKSDPFSVESPSKSYNAKTIFTALVFLSTYDGRTGERIDHGSGHNPSAECDRIVNPAPDSYSAEQKQYIQRVLSLLLDENIASAMQGSGLITEEEAGHSIDASNDALAQETCSIQGLLAMFRTR